MNAPLAVFGYKRPESLHRLFEALLACEGFENTPITVFIDGPRGVADVQAVEACRDVARAFASDAWDLRFAPVNKGLKRSIFEGVSELTARHGRVVVLEDDLVPSPAALRYFNAALDRYRDEGRVWSICGYGWHQSAVEGQHRSYFLPYAHPWGWATWDRAWSRFDLDEAFPAEEILRSPAFRRAFDLHGLTGATDMLELSKRGLIDSWFIRWYFTVFRHGGLSLFPTDSLIANMGFGQGGTHAGRLNPYKLLMGDDVRVAMEQPSFPDVIEASYVDLDRVIASRESRVLRFIGRAGHLRRTVREAWRANG